MADETTKIFFSWQSDQAPQYNTKSIRNALDYASSKLEHNTAIDEATREMAGSGNIPDSILSKIRAADIFVADITPVACNGIRKLPNPNVVFELGYAVAHLGWNRVIMLNNNCFGSVKEAPFDFDRHRISGSVSV